MTKTPFILNDPLYGTERSYSALRQGPDSRHEVEIAVCGTCMDGRGFSGAQLADRTRRGSVSQLTDWTDWNAWTAWADETLVL